MSKNIPSVYCTYKTLSDQNLCVIQNTCPGDQDFSYNKYYIVRQVNFGGLKKIHAFTSKDEDDKSVKHLPFNSRDYKIFDIVGYYISNNNNICPAIMINNKQYGIENGILVSNSICCKKTSEYSMNDLLQQYHKSIKTSKMSNTIIHNETDFYTVENLLNPNLVIIHFINPDKDINGNYRYLQSLSHYAFYIAEKVHNDTQYKLHSRNEFDKANDGYIHVNKNLRFAEYKIEGYISHEKLIYPVIRFEGQYYGLLNGSLRCLENLEVKSIIWSKEIDIKRILEIYHNSKINFTVKYNNSKINFTVKPVFSTPGVFITERSENTKSLCNVLLLKNRKGKHKMPDLKTTNGSDINDDINFIPSVENVLNLNGNKGKVIYYDLKLDNDDLMTVNFFNQMKQI